MERKPVSLVDLGLKCKCQTPVLLLADDLPRPGFYFCDKCDTRYKIVVTTDESENELSDSQ